MLRLQAEVNALNADARKEAAAKDRLVKEQGRLQQKVHDTVIAVIPCCHHVTALVITLVSHCHPLHYFKPRQPVQTHYCLMCMQVVTLQDELDALQVTIVCECRTYVD